MKKTVVLLVASVMLCIFMSTGCAGVSGESASDLVQTEAMGTVWATPTATAYTTPTATVPTGPVSTATAAGESVTTPSPVPTATLPPGIWEESRFRVDLDSDGVKETIIVSSIKNDNPEDNYNISLGVLSKTEYREVFVTEGFFKSAFLTQTQSGKPCLLLSCYDYVGIEVYTTVCSFNGLTPVLNDSIWSWIVDVKGTTITLGNWTDFIGSWNYTCEYELTDDFKLNLTSEMMISTEGRDPLHTIRDLPVEMLVDGVYVEDVLPAGTYVWPVSSDGYSYMTFRLEDGREGRISYTREYPSAMIDGMSEDEYFDNVEYWS